MIKFIYGIHKYGNDDVIAYSNYDEILLDGWTDDELTEDCWILETHKDISDSFETYVFESLTEALIFMEYYNGDFKADIKELYESIIESELVDETVRQFSNVNDLAEEFDVDFMNELEDIVYSKDISMDSVLNSMKLFMLNKYRLGIEEERLSRLN